MSRIPEDPIIVLTQDNEDDTRDYQCGSMSPFKVCVGSGDETAVFPAQRLASHFWSYGTTLPSDADVEVSR